MIRNNDYTQDRHSKGIIMDALIRAYKEKGYDCLFMPEKSEKDAIDLHISLYDENFQGSTIACECKERLGYKFSSYGSEGQEGWMIEEKKIKDLQQEVNKGWHIPLYANLIEDKVVIWDLRKVNLVTLNPDRQYESSQVAENHHKTRKKAYQLFYKDAIILPAYVS